MEIKLKNVLFYFRKKLLIIIMRTFIFLCCISAFSFSSSDVLSQNSKVKIDVDNILTVDEVFDLIMEQTDYKFIYQEGIFKDFPRVHVKKGIISANKLLQKSLSSGDFNVVLSSNNTVLVKERTQSIIKQQAIQVSGVVVDVNGQPLPGANILEKGTANGTQTDFDGKFNLAVADGDAVLIISYLGFSAQEVSVNNQPNINITLQENAASLDEIVVVGYGTQKVTNLTGAVEVITSEALENRPVNNVSNLLAGQASGITAVSGGGQPGRDGSAISIRGNTTFGGSNVPLIIVDGTEGSMNNIDPNDIESLSILKDASASAIYGVRGGNGVIVITTKRGKKGKVILRYNTSLGSQEFTETPSFTNSFDYATLRNEALVNDGNAPEFTDAQLTAFQNGSAPNSDWLGALLTEKGTTQRHHLSLSGGADNFNYNVSLGYLDTDGLLPNTNYKRYNFRANLDQQVNKRLSIGYNLSLSRGDVTEPRGSVSQIYSKNFREHPTQPIVNSDGNYVAFINEHNSIAEANFGGIQSSKTDIFLGTINAKYQLLDGLTINGIASVTQNYDSFNDWDKFLQLYNADGSTAVALASGIAVQEFKSTDINIQTLLTYEKTFNKHYIKALVGHHSIKRDAKNITASRTGLPESNTSDELSLGDPASARNGSSLSSNRLESYFGRLNYNFDERYLAEFSFRRDATSRFAKKNRTEFFPSFSLGWNIHKESFFNVNGINKLKIRGSWGQLGNQDISNLAFASTFRAGRGPELGGIRQTSFIEGVIANPDLRWETITKSNIAIDLALFNNKLQISADYFTEDRDDILAIVPLPGSFGATAPLSNVASSIARGLEMTFKYSGSIGDDFDYSISHNFTNFNKAPTIDGLPETGESPGRSIGDPIDNIFGYQALGLFQNDDEISNAPDQTALGGIPVPGDIRYADINGRDADGNLTGQPDGVVNADDRKSLGTFAPKLFYGFNFAANYKAFDLGIFFQGVGRVKNSLSGRAAHPFANGGKTLTAHLDRWTPTNTNASYPTLHSANGGRNTVTSSFFVYNASYLRLKNIQLGYSLPNNFISKLGVSKFRIYFSGDNLLTFTNSEFPDGFDPEIFGSSNGGTIYPPVKTYTIGLNVTF